MIARKQELCGRYPAEQHGNQRLVSDVVVTDVSRRIPLLTDARDGQ